MSKQAAGRLGEEDEDASALGDIQQPREPATKPGAESVEGAAYDDSAKVDNDGLRHAPSAHKEEESQEEEKSEITVARDVKAGFAKPNPGANPGAVAMSATSVSEVAKNKHGGLRQAAATYEEEDQSAGKGEEILSSKPESDFTKPSAIGAIAMSSKPAAKDGKSSDGLSLAPASELETPSFDRSDTSADHIIGGLSNNEIAAAPIVSEEKASLPGSSYSSDPQTNGKGSRGSLDNKVAIAAAALEGQTATNSTFADGKTTRRERRQQRISDNRLPGDDSLNEENSMEIEEGGLLDLPVGAVPVEGIKPPTMEQLPVESPVDDRAASHPPASYVAPIAEAVNPEGLAMAIAINEDEEAPFDADFYRAEEIEDMEVVEKGLRGFVRRNMRIIGPFTCLAVVGMILGIVFGIREADPDVIGPEEAVLLAGSIRFQEAARVLLRRDVSIRQELLSPTRATPQYLALTWIADEDEAATEPTDEDSMIQRFSLAVLYYATGGDEWIDGYGFMSASNECDWNSLRSGVQFGVTECSEQGFVTKLVLGDSNLNGTLPYEFGQFPFLEFVEYSNNINLNGSIPSTIGLLTSMSTIQMQNTGISGGIPSEIGTATSLKEIFWNTNGLSGVIPSEIGQLTLLQSLFIRENDLSGPLPNEIGSLTSLELLFLYDNALTGVIPASLSGLESLRQVDLAYNQFIDGAETICETESMALVSYITDCLRQVLPAIPREICCSCCTSCCSESYGGCLSPDQNEGCST